MSKPTECDYCHAEMIIKSKVKLKGVRYKKTNLICPVCGYEKSIFGSGERDESEAAWASGIINSEYKRQEKARK